MQQQTSSGVALTTLLGALSTITLCRNSDSIFPATVAASDLKAGKNATLLLANHLIARQFEGCIWRLSLSLSVETLKLILNVLKKKWLESIGLSGDVVSARVSGQRIILKIAINPKWDLPQAEKESYLREWITAKVKVVFKVISVSAWD
jgi:hypothetical protein